MNLYKKLSPVCTLIIISRFDKYKYFTDEEILASDWSRVTEKAKITYQTLIFCQKSKNNWNPRKRANEINWKAWKQLVESNVLSKK